MPEPGNVPEGSRIWSCHPCRNAVRELPGDLRLTEEETGPETLSDLPTVTQPEHSSPNIRVLASESEARRGSSGRQARPHSRSAGPGCVVGPWLHQPDGPVTAPGAVQQAKLQRQTNISSKHDPSAKHRSGENVLIYNSPPITPPPCVPGPRPVSLWTRQPRLQQEPRPRIGIRRLRRGTVFLDRCVPVPAWPWRLCKSGRK